MSANHVARNPNHRSQNFQPSPQKHIHPSTARPIYNITHLQPGLALSPVLPLFPLNPVNLPPFVVTSSSVISAGRKLRWTTFGDSSCSRQSFSKLLSSSSRPNNIRRIRCGLAGCFVINSSSFQSLQMHSLRLYTVIIIASS